MHRTKVRFLRVAQHEYTVCETSSTCISKPTPTMPSQHSLLCWMHYEWLRLCDRLSTLWQLAFLDASPLHAFVSDPIRRFHAARQLRLGRFRHRNTPTKNKELLAGICLTATQQCVKSVTIRAVCCAGRTRHWTKKHIPWSSRG